MIPDYVVEWNPQDLRFTQRHWRKQFNKKKCQSNLKDAKGKIDLQPDTNHDNQPADIAIKYKKEGRCCFGVASVMLHAGTIQIQQCMSLIYTEKLS